MWADQAVAVAAVGCSALGPAQPYTVLVLPVIKGKILQTALAITHGELAELLVADHASGGWLTTRHISCFQQQLRMLCCSIERHCLRKS